ncbi:transglutaminase family protein [Psychrobacter sp. AH5]|uniref:transglutaminase-like domain-containing protein n=1 Tax=Psychrobacter sp. AH5 TaxID=2937433 RepID=UPI003340DDDE
MILKVNVKLHYRLSAPMALLLQIEAADLVDQRVRSSEIWTSDVAHFSRVGADEGIGERIWIRTEGDFSCTYTAQITVDRPVLDLSTLPEVPLHLLPGETIKYLMPSRYCPSDQFQAFVDAEFGDLAGGARIAAMRNWIESAFSYVPGSSHAQTTALDSFVQRQGVCRDFAHVLVSLARASSIPARFASVYAPEVTPQDFHAVAEVYLGGSWHLIDPTGMADADTMARIGVGADASSVAFLSAFGSMELINQSVSVTRQA